MCARPSDLVRLAGSPARAAAVEAVLDGRPDDAEPDDGDMIAARLAHPTPPLRAIEGGRR